MDEEDAILLLLVGIGDSALWGLACLGNLSAPGSISSNLEEIINKTIRLSPKMIARIRQLAQNFFIRVVKCLFKMVLRLVVGEQHRTAQGNMSVEKVDHETSLMATRVKDCLLKLPESSKRGNKTLEVRTCGVQGYGSAMMKCDRSVMITAVTQ